mgnify:CR=1 FL=1
MEEGQEEIIKPDISDTLYVNREFNSQGAQASNLLKVLNQIEYIFNKFCEKHVSANKNGKVQVNYPKYLSKYSLFKL